MDRPQFEVADVFRCYGTDYRQEHGASMSNAQHGVMTAIEVCRTAFLGGHLEQCDQCGHQRNAYNSCGNKHCPKCQSLARAQWLQDRQAELLNTEYFHVVFTLPEVIATIAYQNKKELYGILFHAAAETLRIIAADPKHLGAEIGSFAVLHTWGSNLLHHPHLHCVVPAVDFLRTAPSGFPDELDFFCPCGCSPVCFAVCSWNNWSKLMTPVNWRFPPLRGSAVVDGDAVGKIEGIIEAE